MDRVNSRELPAANTQKTVVPAQAGIQFLAHAT
jgi:hypothetical protein